VNNRTMPEDNAALPANTVAVQDLCSLGMDQALGIEENASREKAPAIRRFYGLRLYLENFSKRRLRPLYPA